MKLKSQTIFNPYNFHENNAKYCVKIVYTLWVVTVKIIVDRRENKITVNSNGEIKTTSIYSFQFS